jgi:hypothetical protein
MGANADLEGEGPRKGRLDMGAEKHLNSHQRDTVAHIFRHPLSHNIEWHAVVSLLSAVGSVHETNKGHMLVTIGSDTETFEPPRHKDLDAEQLATLRRLLKRAGYGPDRQA